MEFAHEMDHMMALGSTEDMLNTKEKRRSFLDFG